MHAQTYVCLFVCEAAAAAVASSLFVAAAHLSFFGFHPAAQSYSLQLVWFYFWGFEVFFWLQFSCVRLIVDSLFSLVFWLAFDSFHDFLGKRTKSWFCFAGWEFAKAV